MPRTTRRDSSRELHNLPIWESALSGFVLASTVYTPAIPIRQANYSKARYPNGFPTCISAPNNVAID